MQQTIRKHTIEWDGYRPSPAVQSAVSYLNARSLEKLLTEIPAPQLYTDSTVTFDYRIYTSSALDEVETVYILLNGFAERAGSPDSGIKNLITDLLLQQTETRPYAVLVVGGLVSFPARVRSKLVRQGYGALAVIANAVDELLATTFEGVQSVTVSGYSLGGVLAPLVARVISDHGTATIEQVCCGEPNYIDTASSKLQLLKRVSRSTAYRNDQITATAIQPYIAVKQTPETKWAMVAYRAKQYRPLFGRALSMRLVVQDLAIQARNYPAASRGIQLREALLDLAERGLRVNLLHAEFSPLCHQEPFTELAANLMDAAGGPLTVITIRGKRADHGIEECRTLSTPFLVMPELYWATS